jgi:hypothetical protein
MRLLALLLVLAAFSPSAAAQFECNLPTTNEWLWGEVYQEGPDLEIAPNRVFTVSRNLRGAIALLKRKPAVALTAAEARRFAGNSLKVPAGRSLRPYLVRAVFPSEDPTIEVSWGRGDRLRVFTEGLGCNPHEKYPIVVFLDRKPKHVFVTTSAAL